MLNLNRIAKIAKKNALVGGDVLCVLRYIDGYLTIQLIDGSLVQSPIFGTESYPQQLPNGNKIINGIEINPRGQHVRYYVRDKKKGIIPIEARSESSGLVQAWLIYGMEYRLNNVRGLPMIAAVIETLKKMERYKEATIAGAEERAKIAYTIEHEKNSTGENPLIETMAKAYKVNAAEDIPEDIKGKKLQNSVSATLNKTAINMPIDAKLKMHESKQELIFKEFFTVNIELICAALQIPPDVAKSKYDSNFSASRAALKDWEHTLNVGREEFADDFYQKVYNFWLYTEVLNGKISAKGYLEASLKGNQMVLDAYQNARFVGPSVPHIDPWKEVKAEREKLGLGAAYIPLTTVESATENLNGSDSNENLKQYGDELQKAKDLKIIPEIVTPPGGGGALDPNALKNQLDSIQAMLEELQLVR
jgi:capsid protein